MDQPVGGTSSDAPVTLTYTATGADLQHAMNAGAKAASRARRVLLIATYVALALAVTVFLGSIVLNGMSWDRSVLLVPLALVVIGMTQWIQRRMYRKLAEAMGETTLHIDDSGVTVMNATSTSDNVWQAYGRYLETPKAFVLLNSAQKPVIVTPLPKRGLASQADAERLRALLDRHLPRG